MANGHSVSTCSQAVKAGRTVFLTELAHFPLANPVITEYFSALYPERAAIGAASLPRGAGVEMDAVMVIGD